VSSLGYICEELEIKWQNLELEVNKIRDIYKVIYFNVKFQNKIFRGNHRLVFLLSTFLKLATRIVKDSIYLDSQKFREKHIFHFLLNQYITEKHLSAIAKFLNSDSEYLLVSENDVILIEEPEHFLKEVLEIGLRYPNALFMNISNNSSFSKVSDHFGGQIKGFENSNVWNEIDFFVNGTAFYFMNRKMAEIIHDFVVRRPSYRNCSVDWLFSLIGRAADRSTVTCLIPLRNFVGNGSRAR